MSKIRITYMPLSTYPEAVPDSGVKAAVGFASSFAEVLHVTLYSASIPQMYSPVGGLLLDIPGLVHAAEEKSRAECRRLDGLVRTLADQHVKLDLVHREVILGAAFDAAASEARYYDLSVLPWSSESIAPQDMTQAIVFGSGRPTVVVPPSARFETETHLAVAWDGSRVAARALGDALALLPTGGQISVLTIQNEKPLPDKNLAHDMAASLEKRGFITKSRDIVLGKRTIAEALQEEALNLGATLLAMGGYGHSRVRDFILGGATKGILTNLRLPVLLSH